MLYFKLSKVSKTWKQLLFHHLGTDDIHGDGGSNLQVTGHTVGGRCGNKSGGDFLDFGKMTTLMTGATHRILCTT